MRNLLLTQYIQWKFNTNFKLHYFEKSIQWIWLQLKTEYNIWSETSCGSNRTNIGVSRLPNFTLSSPKSHESKEKFDPAKYIDYPYNPRQIAWAELSFFFLSEMRLARTMLRVNFNFRIINDFKIIRNSMYLSMTFFRRKLTEHWSWHKLNVEYNFSQRCFPCFSYKEAILQQSAARVLFNTLSSTLDFSRLLLLTFHTIETRLLRCRKNISIET